MDGMKLSLQECPNNKSFNVVVEGAQKPFSSSEVGTSNDDKQLLLVVILVLFQKKEQQQAITLLVIIILLQL
jgi:hypothetical protein